MRSGDLPVVWMLGVLLLFPTSGSAGHGFMTAFATIEWLPEPGRTPDSPWYRVDVWQEEGQLFLANSPAETISLCLVFSREKLAEVEAMVRAENATAAEVAASRYRAYIARARAMLPDIPGDAGQPVEDLATALLEHQYILAVLYRELPPGTRAVVVRLIEAADAQYQTVSDKLGRKQKGSFFFREEEVRWSVQMALRADEDQP